MNTAKQSIDLLDVLTLDELKALTDEELRRFEALLSHWQQLAMAERERQRSEDPARQPQATNDLSVAVRLAWVWASRRDIT